jgi:Xaa-Pro aminopeptidase
LKENSVKEVFLSRQKQVQTQVPKDLDAFLVTGLSNVRYLTGFTGSCGWVLLLKKSAVFFTDFRYQEQADTQVGGAAEIVVYKNSMLEALEGFLKKKKVRRLGVESSLMVEHYEAFRKVCPDEVRILKGLPEKVRRQKDESELVSLRRAFAIADKAFGRILPFVKPGRTELEIAAKLEYLMRHFGSEGPSFSTIVASGPRSSCPHASPTDRKLRSEEMVKIDFGAVSGGYHSDMTRTVFLGKATTQFRSIYKIVLDAQKKAIAALKPGMTGKQIDDIARDYIQEKGYGEQFGHGLGHSLGLDIHESPALSPRCVDVIEPGMIFTVEPGIYVPGWGGVRIEDVFVVGEQGLEQLTKTPNSMRELS